LSGRGDTKKSIVPPLQIKYKLAMTAEREQADMVTRKVVGGS